MRNGLWKKHYGSEEETEMEAIETVNRITLLVCAAVIGAAVYFQVANKKKQSGKGKKQKQKKSQKTVAAEPDVKRQKQLEWGIFAALMLLALGVRAWQFGSIPGGMNQDGAMAAVDAKALADYATDRYGMHMPVHFTAWGYGQMSVLLSYLMVPFIKLFGLSAVTARLPMLLVSLCGMAAAYFLFRRLFGVRAGQIVLAFLIFNPWHFMQSRWALDCNVFPHMFLLGVFFMLKGIADKKRYLFISMVFYALCMYSYGISFYTVPVFLLAICIYMLVKKVIGWKEAGISAGVYALVSWPIYTTMALNTLRLKTIETPFFTMPFFPDSVRSQDILFFADDKWEQLGTNIKAMMSVILEGDTLPWNTIPGFGTIYTCFLLFVPVGIYYAVHVYRKEKDLIKRTGCLSLLFFFGIGILAGILTASVNVNRINIMMYPMILFAAMGIYFVYESRKKLALVLVPVYLLLGVMFVNQYFTDYAESIRYSFFDGFIEAVQDLEESSNCQVYCITPDSQYQGSYHVSEILTLFALQLDAKYYQGETEGDEIPYANKFYYCNASQTQVDASSGVGYVVSTGELGLFPESDYHIELHDNFGTVIPLNCYKGE